VPIYEFYCCDCHIVFNFLSRSPSSKRPKCPRCSRPRLERKASAFAISKGRPESAGGDEGPDDFDEARMEAVMAEIGRDVEKLDENDPRQMAGFMRTIFERTGMPVGPGIDEAIRRMEAGEDPDKIEDEMGDLLEDEGDGLLQGGAGGSLRRLRSKLRPPAVDKTLHEL
jgi:putative FmdB family regulatory protein